MSSIFSDSVDDDNMMRRLVEAHNVFSLSQQKVLAIVPEIAAAISFCSAWYIAVTAFRSREDALNRILLGLAANLLVLCPWQMCGALAVPVGSPDVWGARGTTQTCAAQGFFFQLGYSVPFYYASLSLYGLYAVVNNFKMSKFVWIEKWIHFGVPVFPLISAVYLLIVEAFNYAGQSSCWVASVPHGCGGRTGNQCTRGPQKIIMLSWIFRAAPSFLLLICPTIAIASLYTRAQRNPSQMKVRSQLLAQQAALYLLALYGSYFFSFANLLVELTSQQQVFVLTLLASTTEKLMGLWVSMLLLQFRSALKREQDGCPTLFDSSSSMPQNRDKKVPLSTTTTHTQCSKSSYPAGDDGDSGSDDVDCIFDGSNASGKWAEFIHAGDFSDAIEEERESEHWNAIQTHI